MDQQPIIPIKAGSPQPGETLTTTESNGQQAATEADLARQSPVLPGGIQAALAELRQEVAGGFLYSHSRANTNTSRLLETTAFLFALIELLDEKGLITIEELDARKDAVAGRVEKRFLDKGMGVNLQEPEQDKYTPQGGVQIDCENRVHLCKAACCRLWFPLSRQDVDEGVVQWDFRFPYIINQHEDGYCKHMDRPTCRCTVYDHRPLPCRAFDCRGDKRIWLDFEKMEINPNLEEMFPKNQQANPIEPDTNGAPSQP